jgi:ABC-type sugar transport system ATPase subunit
VTDPAGDVVLQAKAITKSYASQRVLDDVDVAVRSGEILALLGENGAGKSTLMRILAGATRLDSGSIIHCGTPITIGSVRQAQNHGIAMIFQELNLVPSRSVAQNIFLGREPRLPGFRSRLGIVDQRALAEQADRVLRVVGSKIEAGTKVSELTVGQQQQVEIAKAISFKAQVLLMDEPTSALSEDVAANLLRLMQELKARGMGIVFTTHRLPEAFKVADRFLVLRDGRVAGGGTADRITEADLVEMMVGRPMAQHYPKADVAIRPEPVLEVSGLSGGMVRDVSFSVRPGEILGFAGLVGAGRTEMARLIFGADRPSSGEIRLAGKPVSNRSPVEAIARGVGFVPEDRKKESLMLGRSVRENIVLAGLRKLADRGLVRSGRLDSAALHYAERLGIRLRSLDQPVASLSGGNQQKCVLSRWLLLSTRVLILDEPTRGVDVGAKETIYRLIGELAGEGLAIIFISSELPEVLGLSDRIAVMSEGRVVAILDRNEASPEVIMRHASHVAH